MFIVMDARIRPIGSETGPGMATAIGSPHLLNKKRLRPPSSRSR